MKSSVSTNYSESVIDEEMDKIKRLQNGSDVRGVALEGEKGRSVDLTPAAVEAIVESFGEWVIRAIERDQGRPVEDVRVSLGRDPRLSGSLLSVAVLAGLSRAGCVVFNMGLATTPACFMSTQLLPFSYDASIMVIFWQPTLNTKNRKAHVHTMVAVFSCYLQMTASHLPYTRNGLKFFTKKGGLTSPEVAEICGQAARKYANRSMKVSMMLRTPPEQVNFMSAYAKHLRDIIMERVNHPTHYDTPLQGFQVTFSPCSRNVLSS